MIANLLLTIALAYAAIGCVVAAAFLVFGIDRVDPTAHGAYAFRPLLAPGAIMLWPVVAWRWRALAAGA
ncbi:MAG: hypothetical protein K2P80_14570 [Beijerinckiaceae bacterium]|nr:hypothetical protein [Beijerinckiaceae bacterium]